MTELQEPQGPRPPMSSGSSIGNWIGGGGGGGGHRRGRTGVAILLLMLDARSARQR